MSNVFSVTRFGLGHKGGVYIPNPTNAGRAFDVDSKDWVLTPKSDKNECKSDLTKMIV